MTPWVVPQALGQGNIWPGRIQTITNRFCSGNTTENTILVISSHLLRKGFKIITHLMKGKVIDLMWNEKKIALRFLYIVTAAVSWWQHIVRCFFVGLFSDQFKELSFQRPNKCSLHDICLYMGVQLLLGSCARSVFLVLIGLHLYVWHYWVYNACLAMYWFQRWICTGIGCRAWQSGGCTEETLGEVVATSLAGLNERVESLLVECTNVLQRLTDLKSSAASLGSEKIHFTDPTLKLMIFLMLYHLNMGTDFSQSFRTLCQHIPEWKQNRLLTALRLVHSVPFWTMRVNCVRSPTLYPRSGGKWIVLVSPRQCFSTHVFRHLYVCMLSKSWHFKRLTVFPNLFVFVKCLKKSTINSTSRFLRVNNFLMHTPSRISTDIATQHLPIFSTFVFFNGHGLQAEWCWTSELYWWKCCSIFWKHMSPSDRRYNLNMGSFSPLTFSRCLEHHFRSLALRCYCHNSTLNQHSIVKDPLTLYRAKHRSKTVADSKYRSFTLSG